MSEQTEIVYPQPDDETKKKIDLLMHYVSVIRDNGAFDVFSDLFQTDYRILNYLLTNPVCHPSEIADALDLSRPNIAASLKTLEAKGWITREIDKDNRRQIFVTITDEGLNILKTSGQKLSYLFASWFRILGEEEVEHLFKILDISSDPSLISDELRHFSFTK